MQEYDNLPKALRIWVAEAALPWSARSVKKQWVRALENENGCEKRAMETMARLEKNNLRKDAPKTWGVRSLPEECVSPEAIR